MADLDFSSLQGLQGQANQASNDAASLAQNTPGLLDQLRSNLTTIFAKDNPVIEARGQALADFLSTPQRARAEFLPSNLPQVEGSNLNLSPTQQDAIVAARHSAALAPLAGLNQIITGIYGNIPELVGKAGDIYQSQIQAAQIRAQMLQQQYQNSLNALIAEENAKQEQARQEEIRREFDITQTQKNKGVSSGIDYSPLLSGLPTPPNQTSFSNKFQMYSSPAGPINPAQFDLGGSSKVASSSIRKPLPDNLMARNSLNISPRSSSSGVLNTNAASPNFSPIANFLSGASNWLGNAGNALLTKLAYLGG